MRSLFLFAAACSLIFSGMFWTAEPVQAAEDASFVFEMEGNVRTTARRHRGLVPISDLIIQSKVPVQQGNELKILLPEELEVIWSSNLSNVQYFGSGADKVDALTIDSLSLDQKVLTLRVGEDLVFGDELKISGLRLKVFNLGSKRFEFQLMHPFQADEVTLGSTQTVYLDRSQGPKRSITPELLRRLDLTAPSPTLLKLDWTPSPDLDFLRYRIVLRSAPDLSGLEEIEIEDRSVVTHQFEGLVVGESYQLDFDVQNKRGLAYEYRLPFVAGELQTTLDVNEDSGLDSEETPDEPSMTNESLFLGLREDPDAFSDIYNSLFSEDMRALPFDGDELLTVKQFFDLLEDSGMKELLRKRTARRLRVHERMMRKRVKRGKVTFREAVHLFERIAREQRLKPNAQVSRASTVENRNPLVERHQDAIYGLQRKSVLTDVDLSWLDPNTEIRQEDWVLMLDQLMTLLRKIDSRTVIPR